MIGIPILFACFPAIGGETSASDKEQSKKIAQVNSENNNETKIMMDYALIPFARLIGMADLIVIGGVEGIGGSTFNFHVDEFLLHNNALKSINVVKYIPAEIFAPRALPYARGQRFSLFLMKPEQDSADLPWRILGYAGEGEMPIEDEFVYFGAYDLSGLEYKPREIQGVTRNLQRFNLDDFKDAVKKYHSCFSWNLVKFIKNKKKRSRWVPLKTCHNESVKIYREKSWLHEYLVHETIKKIPEKHR